MKAQLMVDSFPMSFLSRHLKDNTVSVHSLLYEMFNHLCNKIDAHLLLDVVSKKETFSDYNIGGTISNDLKIPLIKYFKAKNLKLIFNYDSISFTVPNKTIYFDMDGVLFNFVKLYNDNYDSDLSNVKYHWNRMVNNKFFEKLDKISLGHALFQHYVNNPLVHVEILSTCGSSRFKDIKNQKINSLTSSDIHSSHNFVKTNMEKSKYASTNTLLIDDRELCTVPFENKGGKVLLFNEDMSLDDMILSVDKFIIG